MKKSAKKNRSFILFAALLLVFLIIGGPNAFNAIEENGHKLSPTASSEVTPETPATDQSNTQAPSDPQPDTNASKGTPVSGKLVIHFIDVGQADAILIQQGSHAMLIDGGNNDDGDDVCTYISSQGVTELEYVVGTHAHEDHIGGIDDVINKFNINKVYFPKQTATTKTFTNFANAVKSKGLGFTTPVPGDTFSLGEAKCTILAPNGSSYEDANNYSIVIKVVFGSTSFLLTGDAEDVSEKEILSKGYDVSADVLKVGHHGSNYSTIPEFLSKVNPKYAVISVGKDNKYGHPGSTTMNRLKDAGIPIYRTDESGTIIATSDGTAISFNVSPGSYVYGNNDASAPSVGAMASASSSGSAAAANASDDNESRTVYYTEKGKSYHYDKNCSTLSRSKNIIESTLKEAKEAGKNDPCDRCVGN